MTDRNWEQELAKIDKQLASVSDDQLLAQTNAQRAGAPAAPNAGAKPAVAAKVSAPTAPTRTAGSWMAWVQLIVAVGAASGLWFWPWATRCGLNAVAFTSATGAVTLLGLWSAVGSWRHRQSYAHVLSFGVMVWGLVLGAREVLPRVGYAIPSEARPAGWRCEAPTTAPVNVPGVTVPAITPPAGSATPSLTIPPPPVSNGTPPR